MTSDIATETLVRVACDALIGLFRHAPGFEARLTRDTWLVASGEPHPELNWIAVVAPGPAAEAALRDHVAAMRARGLPALVFLTPNAAEACASALASLGLIASKPAPMMVCRLDHLPRPRPADGLEIVPIRDAAMLRAGVDVYADSFGIPPASAERVMGEDVLREPALTPYAATREDAVLAVAATSRSGNVLYLDLMATAPAHRRQGIGSALLGHVLAEHAATGATHAFMLASDEGRALYERLGFRVLFEAAIWVVPATVAHTP